MVLVMLIGVAVAIFAASPVRATTAQSKGVWRPHGGNWYVYPSSTPTQFGLSADIPVQRDYNGDNNTEFAVYRPHGGNWFVYPNFTPTQFGLSCDMPVPADYNGDGKAEFAVWRPHGGNWFVYPNFTPTQYGLSADVPVPADYDGVGHAQFAVYRPHGGLWYVYPSEMPIQFGLSADIPVPADYNGDGRAEFAVYRPHGGLWFVYPSSTPTQFGLSGDIPVPGDYNGDGMAEFAVWRPSTGMWYVYPDLTHPVHFGLPGDVPSNILPSVYYLKYFVSPCSSTPPTVISTVPANGGPCLDPVPLTITATFSKAMNPTTIDNVTFTLKHGATSDNGTVTYDNLTATFTPVPPIEPNDNYTATISIAARDMAGNHLASPYVWSFTTCGPTAPNPTAPPLGEVGRYVILASQTITTTPAASSSIRNGDLGILDEARTYYHGFTPTGPAGDFTELTGGTSYAPDDTTPFPVPNHYQPPHDPYATIAAMIDQSRTDLGTAYTFLAATNPTAATQACPTELGGLVLDRGVYYTAAPVTIQTGDLTLDAQGDPDSVWVFSIDQTLTTAAPGGNVILAHGAQAKNVYWRVATTTHIAANTTFYGNVFDGTEVTVDANANITGSLFGKTNQVTLISDNITKAP